MDLRQVYLSKEGRIARLPYFGFSFVLSLPYVLLSMLLVNMFGFLGSILVLALYAIVAFPYYCLMAKRLQDFNQPGKWAIALIGLGLVAALMQFVPVLQGLGYGLTIVQGLAALGVLLMPGTSGDNDFGPQPGKLVAA